MLRIFVIYQIVVILLVSTSVRHHSCGFRSQTLLLTQVKENDVSWGRLMATRKLKLVQQKCGCYRQAMVYEEQELNLQGRVSMKRNSSWRGTGTFMSNWELFWRTLQYGGRESVRILLDRRKVVERCWNRWESVRIRLMDVRQDSDSPRADNNDTGVIGPGVRTRTVWLRFGVLERSKMSKGREISCKMRGYV
jgi:hypothetical protein